MRAVIRLVAMSMAAALCLHALPAWAASGSITDPNDVHGRLDLARLSFIKPAGTAPFTITVRTYDPWPKRVLRDHVNRLAVFIDTDGDGTKDYTARIRKSGAHLVANISGSGSSFEPLPVERPNRRTVRFTIPGNSPPNPNGPAPHLRAYSVFIESLACDPASGHMPCVDHAPDTAWL
jgi:hypothetical protein